MVMNEQTPFEQALKDVMLEEFADIPPEEEIDIAVSDRFRKYCARLIRQSRRGTVRHVRSTVRRAILIAALIALLATTAMAIPDVRETFIGFFVRDEGTHYEFCFDPEQAATAPQVIEKVYHATYIPEGYTQVSADVSLAGSFYFWFDDTYENYIMFYQTVIGGVDRVPNADGSATQTLNLDGYQVFCTRDQAAMYFWTDNEYFYSLYCGPDISEAEMRKIFSGIEVDENAVIEP